MGDYCEMQQAMLPAVLTVEALNRTPGDAFLQAAKLLKLIGTADAFSSDAALARQLKRRWLGKRAVVSGRRA